MSVRTLQKNNSGSFFAMIPPAFVELAGMDKGTKLDVKYENGKVTIAPKGLFSDVEKGLQQAAKQINKELLRK